MKASQSHLGLWFFTLGLMSGFLTVQAQEKQRVRVSANPVLIMPERSSIELQARFRGENGFEPASGLGFEVACIYPGDSLVTLGQTQTDATGFASFSIPELGSHYRDSTGMYAFRVSSLEHPDYRPVSRDVSFKRARLDAHVVREGENAFLKATLLDGETGLAQPDQPLKVRVLRLFSPLVIGGDFNMTDPTGSVQVLIPNDLPGLDGNLQLEAVLSDHDAYGTVIAPLEAPLGVPIEDRSTFDQRTMWSPASKTPMFLLTVANLLILGAWGTIFYLIRNLIKINKAKPDIS